MVESERGREGYRRWQSTTQYLHNSLEGTRVNWENCCRGCRTVRRYRSVSTGIKHKKIVQGMVEGGRWMEKHAIYYRHNSVEGKEQIVLSIHSQDNGSGLKCISQPWTWRFFIFAHYKGDFLYIMVSILTFKLLLHIFQLWEEREKKHHSSLSWTTKVWFIISQH